jgi:hypothetical protein
MEWRDDERLGEMADNEEIAATLNNLAYCTETGI